MVKLIRYCAAENPPESGREFPYTPTLLHLLGFDYARLTYSFSGRETRLTDVFDKVVDPILA